MGRPDTGRCARHMIIQGSTKFISAPFSSEQELESVVQANAELIFGPDSIYLPKALIHTADGIGTIPDGFVIDLATRRWFIVEAELAAHSVWSHIAPQVAKQIIAATQPPTRRTLTEVVVNLVRENATLKEKFADFDIDEIDIRRVLGEIFESSPIVGMPIDEVGADLREWAQTLRSDVRLWRVRKLVEFGNPTHLIYEIPDEYRPVLDSSPDATESASGLKYYDVGLGDLVERGLLKLGETLNMACRPRGGERKQYEATVVEGGGLQVMGKSFSAPSYAALLCIQNAGSDRNTVNGWTTWRNADGHTLADLRDKFLEDSRPAK